MNIFKDTKNAIVDRVKGYFTINNVSYHLNEQAVTTAFSSTYDAISVLSRCTDMIINTAAATELIIVEDTGILNKRTSFSKFEKLLANPDPTMSELQFRKMIYRDLFFSGNTFIYNLGNALQILSSVEYSDDNKPSSGGIALDEDRLTHIRLLNESGYQYGRSYLTRIDNEIKLITKMLNFQSNYFSNNGFPGVILETDHPLAKRSKERLAEEFVNMFSIQKGVSGKPFVLDNSIKMRAGFEFDPYRQRNRVETVNSVIERKRGEFVRVTKVRNQNREILFTVMIHNYQGSTKISSIPIGFLEKPIIYSHVQGKSSWMTSSRSDSMSLSEESSSSREAPSSSSGSSFLASSPSISEGAGGAEMAPFFGCLSLSRCCAPRPLPSLFDLLRRGLMALTSSSTWDRTLFCFVSWYRMKAP